MFYKDGLKFSCQMCSYCCSVEPGFVFLRKIDIENISSFLSISEDEFISLYTRFIDNGEYYLLSLKEKENYDCEFLGKNGCIIYSCRPIQCETYPFWGEILKSESTWKREGEYCEGIGKGEVVNGEEIERKLDRYSEELYKIYKK